MLKQSRINENPTLWITWEKQRRNRTLSSSIGARLVELDSKLPRMLRYIHLILATFFVLLKAKEKNIIAQNPSIVLAFFANIFSRIFRKKIIIDSHNGGIFPLEGTSKLLNYIARLIIQITPITIVSNDVLASYVQKVGGRAMVIPDPIPEFKISKNKAQKNNAQVLFICTWSDDEPYLEVIDAAKKLTDNFTIYITGSFKEKINLSQVEIPNNVILTGYIDDSEYENLLAGVDCCIILTTRENCLVCGAYESVSQEKPMILSDTLALKKYFYLGAIFTSNDSSSIAEAIKNVFANQTYLKNEIKNLKKDLLLQWETHKNSLLNYLNE